MSSPPKPLRTFGRHALALVLASQGVPGGLSVRGRDMGADGGDRGGQHGKVIGKAETEDEVGDEVHRQHEVAERGKQDALGAQWRVPVHGAIIGGDHLVHERDLPGSLLGGAPEFLAHLALAGELVAKAEEIKTGFLRHQSLLGWPARNLACRPAARDVVKAPPRCKSSRGSLTRKSDGECWPAGKLSWQSPSLVPPPVPEFCSAAPFGRGHRMDSSVFAPALPWNDQARLRRPVCRYPK